MRSDLAVFVSVSRVCGHACVGGVVGAPQSAVAATGTARMEKTGAQEVAVAASGYQPASLGTHPGQNKSLFDTTRPEARSGPQTKIQTVLLPSSLLKTNTKYHFEISSITWPSENLSSLMDKEIPQA